MSQTVWRVRALLFDLDGVLVDSRRLVERIWRDWAVAHGRDAEAIIGLAHGRRASETLALVAPELDIAREVAALDTIEERTTEGVAPVAGAAALLATLPANRWAVVTSASRAVAELRLRHTGLPVPAVLVAGDEVRPGKPHPTGYLRAAAKLGVEPAGCVVLEDSPPGVAAGRAAGARVIGLATTYPAERLGDADLVLDRLEQLLVDAENDGELRLIFSNTIAV